MIAEPDKVIQVCTAQALPAGIFMTRSRPISAHLTHGPAATGWRLSLEGVFRGNHPAHHPVRSRAKATQSAPAEQVGEDGCLALMSLRFVAGSRVSRP